MKSMVINSKQGTELVGVYSASALSMMPSVNSVHAIIRLCSQRLKSLPQSRVLHSRPYARVVSTVTLARLLKKICTATPSNTVTA